MANYCTKLIYLVKERAALYDFGCQQYSDKSAKMRLWDEVCAELFENWHALDEDEKVKQGTNIQKRWNHLRDCFRRELKRQKETPPDTQRRKYMYFDDLLFLLPHSKHSTFSTYIQSDEEEYTNSPLSTPSQSIELLGKRAKRTSAYEEEEDSDNTLSTQILSIDREDTEQPPKSIKHSTLLAPSQSTRSSNKRRRKQRTTYEEDDTNSTLPPQILPGEREDTEQPNKVIKPSSPSHSTNLPPKIKTKKSTSTNRIVKFLEDRSKQISLRRRRGFDDDECFLLSLLPSFKKYDYEKKILLRMEILSTVLKVERFQNNNAVSLDLHATS